MSSISCKCRLQRPIYCSAKQSLAELCFRFTSLDVLFGHICMEFLRKWKTLIFSCKHFCQRFQDIGSAGSLEKHVDLHWAHSLYFVLVKCSVIGHHLALICHRTFKKCESPTSRHLEVFFNTRSSVFGNNAHWSVYHEIKLKRRVQIMLM